MDAICGVVDVDTYVRTLVCTCEKLAWLSYLRSYICIRSLALEFVKRIKNEWKMKAWHFVGMNHGITSYCIERHRIG